jgi:hypothetical protein
MEFVDALASSIWGGAAVYRPAFRAASISAGRHVFLLWLEDALDAVFGISGIGVISSFSR